MNTVIHNTTRTFVIAAHMTYMRFRAFDGGGWKMSADGKTIEMKDGNPVWVNADGKEVTLAGDTITRLNGEAKQHRTRAETAEQKLAAYKDVPDPAAALDAMNKIKKIDQKQLIDAGEVDKVRNEISQQFTVQLTEKDNALKEARGTIDGMKIDGIFNNSDFVKNRVAVPPDMFQATFRSNFKINKEGGIEAYDKSGNRVMSKSKIGDYADPDEALEIIVGQHPQHATILKAPDQSGSGNGGGGGNRPGGRSMKRAAFEQLPPYQQAEYSALVRKGDAVLVD